MSIFDNLTARIERLDGFLNEMIGLGTSEDRTSHTKFQPEAWIVDEDLRGRYEYNGMSKIVVSVIPEEIFRQGVVVKHRNKKEILRRARELGVNRKMKEAMIWGRLFGGGLMVLGLDDGQDMSEPLNRKAIRCLEYIDVYDKTHVRPNEIYRNRRDSKYLQPAVFDIFDEDGASFSVHESRCLIFGGAHTTHRTKRARQGWDLSVLQAIDAAIKSFDMNHKAADNMMIDASVGVYKLAGLTKMIAGRGLEALKKRAVILDLWRNITRSIILDSDGQETYERVSAQYSGIDAILVQKANLVSAISRIPVPILMGQSPAGLNATGDSSIRAFYDFIRTEGEEILPEVSRVYGYLAIGIDGDPPEVSFPSLWQESPKEKADREKQEADTDNVRITGGVITPEEATRMRFPDDPSVDLSARPLPPPSYEDPNGAPPV